MVDAQKQKKILDLSHDIETVYYNIKALMGSCCYDLELRGKIGDDVKDSLRSYNDTLISKVEDLRELVENG